MDPATFDQRVADLIGEIKSSRTAPGQRIVVPGELENLSVTTAAGVVRLPAKTIDDLNTLAGDAGVPGIPVSS